jgi:magnesium chelatase subunit I
MDEVLPFPLLAVVGQAELKTALILTLINPRIGGVLLIGPYGVGKTTAVRGLQDIMPLVDCEEADQEGHTHTVQRPMRLIELPLNARIEDVVGGINERVALEQNRVLLEEGILAKAHRNLLYVDEINLLDARVVDAILDAAAQGRTMVRRGPMVRLFASQFVLVGSMNPEEGTLRPQIMDRFGLRVWVAPLTDTAQRLEAYHRAQQFRTDPIAFRALYARQTEQLHEEVTTAREILPHIVVPRHVEALALDIIQDLNIPSHRAEIALLEAALARAAADFRGEVLLEDIERMALPALRQRRSPMLDTYAEHVQQESTTVEEVATRIITGCPAPNKDPAQVAPPDTAHTPQAETQRKRAQRRSTVRNLEEPQP